jgi:hypothetical protein
MRRREIRTNWFEVGFFIAGELGIEGTRSMAQVGGQEDKTSGSGGYNGRTPIDVQILEARCTELF